MRKLFTKPTTRTDGLAYLTPFPKEYDKPVICNSLVIYSRSIEGVVRKCIPVIDSKDIKPDLYFTVPRYDDGSKTAEEKVPLIYYKRPGKLEQKKLRKYKNKLLKELSNV